MAEVLGVDREQSRAIGVRVFDRVLVAANVILVLATALAVPLGYLASTGRGTFTVDAEVDPPYTVEFYDDRAMEVAGGGGGAVFNFPIGEEHRYFDDWPSVRARVKVDRYDTDARAVLAVLLVMARAQLAGAGEPSSCRSIRS